MQFKRITAITLAAVLSGCGGGGGGDPGTGATTTLTPGTTINTARAFTCESDPANPLVGCWTRDRCVKNDPFSTMRYDATHRSDVVSFLKDGTMMSRTRLYANTTCSGVSLQDKVFGSGGTPDNFKVLEAVTLTDGVAGHYIELSAPNPNPTQFRYGVFAIDNSRLCFNDIFVNWGALIPVFESGSWSPLQQQKNKVPLTLEYDAGLINSAVVKSDCFTSGNL